MAPLINWTVGEQDKCDAISFWWETGNFAVIFLQHNPSTVLLESWRRRECEQWTIYWGIIHRKLRAIDDDVDGEGNHLRFTISVLISLLLTLPTALLRHCNPSQIRRMLRWSWGAKWPDQSIIHYLMQSMLACQTHQICPNVSHYRFDQIIDRIVTQTDAFSWDKVIEWLPKRDQTNNPGRIN